MGTHQVFAERLKELHTKPDENFHFRALFCHAQDRRDSISRPRTAVRTAQQRQQAWNSWAFGLPRPRTLVCVLMDSNAHKTLRVILRVELRMLVARCPQSDSAGARHLLHHARMTWKSRCCCGGTKFLHNWTTWSTAATLISAFVTRRPRLMLSRAD